MIQTNFVPADDRFYFPATGIEVAETATMLAIDDASFPLKHNLCLYLTKPQVRAEPVLTPEPLESNAPDNLAANLYGTVLFDGGRFRMWYYACHWGLNEDWSPELKRQLVKHNEELYPGPLCYAESLDGLTWTKPNLDQVLFKGSRANNALDLPHALVSAATLLKDEDDPDPSRRYKLVYEFWPETSDPPLEGVGLLATCATAVSPDGLQWTVIGTPYPYEFLEHSSFYRHDGKFIINSQNMDMHVPGEGGTPRGRTGFARFSPDFDNWLPGQVESFALPEPADPGERGLTGVYDQVHLGVGAVSFGTVCVGLYGRWHNADFYTAFRECSCDLGLVVSNDGLSFREPVKGHIFLSQHESPVTPVSNKHYNTNLCQSNGILNVGDETRIYHGRWRNVGHETGPEELRMYRAEVALAILPRDRWGGLGLAPGQETGDVWTAPVLLPRNACALFLNAEGASGIRVEIGDESFRLLGGYSDADSGTTVDNDGLDCRVRWESGLEALVGRTVRFKIHFQKRAHAAPRLYAVTLKLRD